MTYELTPGIHTLSISVIGYYGPPAALYGGAKLTYFFEAGKTYSIKAEVDLANENYRIWVVDDSTNEELPVIAP